MLNRVTTGNTALAAASPRFKGQFGVLRASNIADLVGCRVARKRLLISALVGALGLTLATNAAKADSSPCRAEGDYLEMSLEGEWPDGTGGAIFAELQAALRVRDIELCVTSPSPSQAIARVRFERGADAHVVIRVFDHVTDKEVSRSVLVADFGPSARALALAVAADELVRASWAELTLEDSPVEASEAPAVVQRAVRETSVVSTTQRTERWLSLSFTFNAYTGGELQLGGSLGFERWLSSRIGLRIVGEGRTSLLQVGEFGSVRARVVSAGLGLLVRLNEPAPFSVAWTFGAQAGWIKFSAEAAPGALASDQSSVLLGLRTGLSLRYSLGAVRFGLEGGVGAPIIGAAAQDGPRQLTGATGFQGYGTFSFAVRL